MTKTAQCDGRLGLRIHAISFAATMALLFAINFLTGGHFWALWTFLAWGIGLAAHAISHAATRQHKNAEA